MGQNQAKLYQNGLNLIKNGNYTEALANFQAAGEHDFSLFEIGEIYYNGLGLPNADKNKACDYYIKSHKLGCGLAQVRLSKLAIDGYIPAICHLADDSFNPERGFNWAMILYKRNIYSAEILNEKFGKYMEFVELLFELYYNEYLEEFKSDRDAAGKNFERKINSLVPKFIVKKFIDLNEQKN